MTKEKASNLDRDSYSSYLKYSIEEKESIAKLSEKYKIQYENSEKTLVWDSKRKKYVNSRKKNYDGFISKAVREFYPSLKDSSSKNPDFRKAVEFARRCHNRYSGRVNNSYSEVTAKRKKSAFREPGGGRKSAAPEVRQALFQWFSTIRGSSTDKYKLTKSTFRAKCMELYQEWLSSQKKEVPMCERLEFSNRWIHDWMKEYHVNLQSPNIQLTQLQPEQSLHVNADLKDREVKDSQKDYQCVIHNLISGMARQVVEEESRLKLNYPSSSYNSDAGINNDALFLKTLQDLFKKHATSSYLLPYLCQIKATHRKAREHLNQRLSAAIEDTRELAEQHSKDIHCTIVKEAVVNSDFNNRTQQMEIVTLNAQNESTASKTLNDFVPAVVVGSSVLVRHGDNVLPASVMKTDPIFVRYYEKCLSGWIVNDCKFEVSVEDIERTLPGPEPILKGSCLFYNFTF